MRPSRNSLLALAVIVAIAFRLERAFRHPDFFEDGYHHWWIGARWWATGRYEDPFAYQVGAIWLPGYHAFVAFASALGARVVDLRIASAAFSAVSVLLVARIAEREKAGAGVPAAFLFALFPFDVIMGAMSLPEPLATVLVLLGVDRLQGSGGATSRALGALALAAACLVRYEAWLVVLALTAWIRPRLALAPAAAVALGWALATLPAGFFVSRIHAQLHGELTYRIAEGAVAADAMGRLATFASIYLPAAALTLLLAAWGSTRRLALVAWLPAAVVVAMVIAGAGSGSVRYLALVAPFACALAGIALAGWKGRFAPVALAAVVLVQGGAAVAEGLYLDQFGVLHDPKLRAGDWLAQNAPDATLVSESPMAVALSASPPERAIGSKLLPAHRDEALGWIREKGAFLVYVGNPIEKYPFHRFQALFPELAAGNSTPDFELVYDANGWEIGYGAQTVYLYRVREAGG